MGVSSVPLRISSRKNSVNQNKGSNNLCTQTSSSAVAICKSVGSTSIPVVVWFLESLNQPNPTDGSQGLSHHVSNGSDQWDLASQEQTKCHCWVNVTPCCCMAVKISKLKVRNQLTCCEQKLLYTEPKWRINQLFFFFAGDRKICWTFVKACS